jgi:hypothetical protein
MKALHVAFIFTGLLLSQNKPEGQTAAKPDLKAKARQLLETAAGTVSAAQPEVQAVALIRLGDAYQALSKKKALELFQQAFIEHCIKNATVSAKKGEALIGGCSRAVSRAIFGCSRWIG